MYIWRQVPLRGLSNVAPLCVLRLPLNGQLSRFEGTFDSRVPHSAVSSAKQQAGLLESAAAFPQLDHELTLRPADPVYAASVSASTLQICSRNLPRLL